MPINLEGAVSDKTKEALSQKDNKPDTESGFENGLDFGGFDSFGGDSSGGGGGGFGDFGDFGDFGGDLGDFGGGSSSGGSSDGTSGGNAFGSGGSTPGFGSSGFGGFGTDPFGSGGGGFGQTGFGMGQTQQPVQAKPDLFDMATDFATESLKAGGGLAKDMLKSLKTKNFDDFGSVMSDWIIGAGVLGILGIALRIIGGAASIGGLSRIGINLLVGGGISLGCGLIGLGISTFGMLTRGAPTEKLADMKDIPLDNSVTGGFDGSLGGGSGDFDLFGDEMDSLMNDYLSDLATEDFGTSTTTTEPAPATSTQSTSAWDMWGSSGSDASASSDAIVDSTMSNDEKIAALSSNAPRIDRKFLVENLGTFYEQNAKGFSESTELSPGTTEYDNIRALTLQAIAEAAKVKLAELETDVVSISSSMYSYVIKVDRLRGLTKTDPIKEEMESFFREDANDVGVSATVTIERGYYKIVLTKGVKDIVTVGDCLQVDSVRKYFLDEDNELPFIAGINQFGEPVMANARNYPSMMVVGRPRSGKSWYLNSVIMALTSFNTPEDINFIIIDPKDSELFRTISTLPHVLGLHKGDYLKIFNEVIYEEGERRKQILHDNSAENIWDLRNIRHVKLPVLFILIDEFMTLKGQLEQQGLYKEFEELFNMAITQLPFVGIHIMFIPHRAQGVLNKTARAQVFYSAAIRASNEIVKETLDCKKWDRPLVNAGDTALQMSDVGVEQYVRAAAISTSDTKNAILIKDIAKAWYKMGVDIPKYPTLPFTYNRDEAEIAQLLGLNASDITHVQYDSEHKYSGTSRSSVDERRAIREERKRERDEFGGAATRKSSPNIDAMEDYGEDIELDADWLKEVDSMDFNDDIGDAGDKSALLGKVTASNVFADEDDSSDDDETDSLENGDWVHEVEDDDNSSEGWASNNDVKSLFNSSDWNS